MIRGSVRASQSRSGPVDKGKSAVSYPETACSVRYRIEIHLPGDDGKTIVANRCSDQVSVRTYNGGRSGTVRLRITCRPLAVGYWLLQARPEDSGMGSRPTVRSKAKRL